jgi:porphobilinogen deaminase
LLQPADLKILSLRGNVDTRIRKAMQGEYDAIVLAAAGVLRLGFASHVAEYLSFNVMLPAPGQGAVAVQCRADDEHTNDLLRRSRRSASRRRAALRIWVAAVLRRSPRMHNQRSAISDQQSAVSHQPLA